ncbi:MAG TPA: radical SAM protein [Terriglobia bacterium]|nr:radical SAM protein [Terriglobia bacterium]
MVALALKSPHHPVLAHVVVTRRCNLSCTYCSEFDDFSKPVPTAEMLHRIDLLAALGTTVITLTGGEPLLHPEIEEIIRRIRYHGIIAISVTNGYLLTPDRIQRLNRAGLDHLQISVDNVRPDDVSKKSLKVLDQKLRWLSQFAEFQVNIHSVVGACTEHPEDALTIARRAKELGLISTAGIVHDSSGALRPLNAAQQKVLDEIESLSKPLFSFARHNPWRKNLIRGLPNEWHCSAGGRHLYICEDGLVHYCMAQRGYPAIPLSRYTRKDIDRESKAKKTCAPYCTIFCIQRVALLDKLRENPREALAQLFPARGGDQGQGGMPVPVRALSALFLPSHGAPRGRFFRKAALRILNID